MKLTLSHQARDDIRNHAEKDYPFECCGFLFGTNGDVRKIIQARKTANIQTGNRKRRFKIDPMEYKNAEKFALDNSLDFLGIYHSHPDHPAEPSEHDRRVAMPYFSYIIVPVHKGKAGDIRSWRLNSEEMFNEESVQILSKQEIIKQQISD
jgi:proteasome lid subunit RPN8/RPN11